MNYLIHPLITKQLQRDGILWASHPVGDANPATVPGVLR